ncbi:hypothetical protein HC891_01875 [Candidatus Gracilibacteria bacterium]|nr:hypothetical protein [Candidatus Gracilibacteria bacterium]
MSEGYSVTIIENTLLLQRYQPTANEQRAFAEMQARLVALLLRFDERRFARRYALRTDEGSETSTDALRPYRDLAALMLLRDELFDDVLPRIVRRLSFEAPRQTMIEEPPPRGRVDWERTLDHMGGNSRSDAVARAYATTSARLCHTP